MASNKDLAKEALALGKELELDVKVEGLNNAKLEALVAKLRAEKAERAKAPPVSGGAVRKSEGEGSKGDSPKPDSTAPPAPPETAPAPKGARVVVVAEGRSVTSKRGILGPGTEVRPEHFAGGEEAVKRLLKAGIFKRA